MRSVELAEIKKRATIISAVTVESLQENLKALHRRNAEKGSLRSGGTVKESASIARREIKSYFNQLEHFVRSRPAGQPGFDAEIIDAVADSTRLLISSINEGLVNTATLVGNPDLVRAIEHEVSGELSTSQETFRSNIRAYWASRSSVSSLSGIDKILIGIEVFCLAAACVTIGMWIKDPQGPYEPYLALFGVGGTLIEIYRRVANRQVP